MATVAYAYGDHPIGRALQGPLKRFYESHGDRFHATTDRDMTVRREHDRVILWNGRGPVWAELCGKADLNIEVGWLPQAGTVYANRYGTTGAAQWPNPDLTVRRDYRAWRKAHLERHARVIVSGNLPAPGIDPVPTPPYVLVIGQLVRDTSMIGSPVQDMGILLRFVRACTDLPIVWRPHPGNASGTKYSAALEGVTCVPGSPLYPTIQGATAVVGISSTVLLEAALCHVPAICIGRNVWSDLPWPHTIPAVADDMKLGGLLADAARKGGAWRSWKPDGLCDFLRRQQVDVHAPVFDPATWRWWA